MRLLSKMLAFAGREGMKIDNSVTIIYLLQECLTYGLMLVRGIVRSIVIRDSSPILFIGRHVKLRCKKSISLGAGVKLKDWVYIDALSSCGVHIGEESQLGRNCRIECTGTLSHLGKGVTIGNRTCFGSDCYFGAAGGISIGSDVIAGQYVRFHSENHRYAGLNELIKDQGTVHQGIKIGSNCWIGAGAVFLDGSSVGDGCVVAANAVVTKQFPNNTVIAGVPGRIISIRS